MTPSLAADQVAAPQAENAPQTQVTLGGKVIASMFFPLKKVAYEIT